VVESSSYHYRDLASGADDPAPVLGQVELDDLLSKRERLNAEAAADPDPAHRPWGVKVSLVEGEARRPAGEMQRAIAKQAEAEREGAPRSSTPRASPGLGSARQGRRR